MCLGGVEAVLPGSRWADCGPSLQSPSRSALRTLLPFGASSLIADCGLHPSFELGVTYAGVRIGKLPNPDGLGKHFLIIQKAFDEFRSYVLLCLRGDEIALVAQRQRKTGTGTP